MRLHRLDTVRHPYAVPYHFPETFVVAMKDVLECKSAFITFDASEELLWDFEAMLQACSHWTPEMCYHEWKALLWKEVALSEGGRLRFEREYWAQE
ncbi:hypothetical protein EJ02DRAFT_146466 [Clathrospora elynae]|uniref:Uncharacterized protein n=1 Tax=Clathrospora elynae TaxID=706981 RepID=A0A6A5T2E2_9PLEO|nr:hypothetical protein EJ02DRAFT_146466 [Clathrospora elynae]